MSSTAGWRRIVAAELAIRGCGHAATLPDEVRPYYTTLLQLARDALWLLEHPLPPVQAEVSLVKYRRLLDARGFLSRMGTVRIVSLIDAFFNAFPPPLLAYLHMEGNPTSVSNWVAQLFRSTRFIRNPVKHLLIMQFFNITAEAFFTRNSQDTQFGSPGGGVFGPGPWPCLNIVCKYYGQDVIEDCKVEQAVQRSRRPRGTFQCTCGFVYERLGPDEDMSQRLTFATIRAFGKQWEQRLLDLWHSDNTGRKPGATIRLKPLAVKLGVSKYFLLRAVTDLGLVESPPPIGGAANKNADCLQLKASPVGPGRRGARGRSACDPLLRDVKRAEWLALRKAHPELGRKALLRLAPALHYWLDHYDKDWFQLHQPQIQCVNWSARDKVLVGKVRTAASTLYAAPGKPRRVTKFAVYKLVADTALLTRLKKLPLTAMVLGEVTETAEAAAVRRIWWALGLYQEEGSKPTRRALQARAGVEGSIAERSQVAEAISDACQILGLPKRLPTHLPTQT
jgi:hypothetical protein